jgi:putative transposase
MIVDPQKHHRHSLRLPGYDYNRAGVYFVTIVTWQRETFLGEIIDKKMHVNLIGLMIQNEWQRLTRRYAGLVTDDFVVMPNHIHGIIVFTGDAPQNEIMDSSMVGPGSLAAVIRGFKSSTALRFNRTRSANGVSLWQRNYYEHIVRDEIDLVRIRQYIQDNPIHWPDDEENWTRVKPDQGDHFS